jgi:glutaredoxin
MNKILPIVIIGIFILSGFGASALNEDIKDTNSKTIESQAQTIDEKAFTHNVLVEYGTTSSCPHCPAVRFYLDTIFSSGDYDFFYITLNGDKNPLANARYWEIPGSSGSVPQVFFDGGYKTLIGNYGSTTPYINYIEDSGDRSVADVDLEVSTVWLGSAKIEVTVNVTNNEGSSYSGHLHAYVTEMESRWYDNSFTKYDFSMIGYAFNQNINVGAGDTWSDTVTWNGASHGYGNIVEDNIMIVASVFDPTSKFVDETAASENPGDINHPPEPPGIYGPSQGIPGKEYDFIFISYDPEESDVWFHINWGDGTIVDWIGPYESGEEVIFSHSWDEEGSKNIEAMAKDEEGIQSDINTKSINIPRTKHSYNSLLLRFLEHYFKAFPILEKLLGL